MAHADLIFRRMLQNALHGSMARTGIGMVRIAAVWPDHRIRGQSGVRDPAANRP